MRVWRANSACEGWAVTAGTRQDEDPGLKGGSASCCAPAAPAAVTCWTKFPLKGDNSIDETCGPEGFPVPGEGNSACIP